MSSSEDDRIRGVDTKRMYVRAKDYEALAAVDEDAGDSVASGDHLMVEQPPGVNLTPPVDPAAHLTLERTAQPWHEPKWKDRLRSAWTVTWLVTFSAVVWYCAIRLWRTLFPA